MQVQRKQIKVPAAMGWLQGVPERSAGCAGTGSGGWPKLPATRV